MKRVRDALASGDTRALPPPAPPGDQAAAVARLEECAKHWGLLSGLRGFDDSYASYAKSELALIAEAANEGRADPEQLEEEIKAKQQLITAYQSTADAAPREELPPRVGATAPLRSRARFPALPVMVSALLLTAAAAAAAAGHAYTSRVPTWVIVAGGGGAGIAATAWILANRRHRATGPAQCHPFSGAPAQAQGQRGQERRGPALQPKVSRVHVHPRPVTQAEGEREVPVGLQGRGERVDAPDARTHDPPDPEGAPDLHPGLARLLRLRRADITSSGPGQVDPPSAALLPREAMGPKRLPGTEETGGLPRSGLEYRQVGSRAMASESKPGTGDRTASAVLPGAGVTKPGEGMNLLLNPPNRRIRDPYVRWCGRKGVARLLPIPIRRTTPGLSARTGRRKRL